MKSLACYSAFALSALLLLALFSLSSVFAGQASAGARPANQQASGERSTGDTEQKPEGPKGSAEKTVEPSGSPSASKDTDEHLSFMLENEKASHEEAPSAAGLLLRTFGALLIIVGLIVAAAWGMKRFGGARFGTSKAESPELAILNSIALGDRRSLAVVRFGERTLLLGSTQHGISLLAENGFANGRPPTLRSVADILDQDAENLGFGAELSIASAKLGNPNLASQDETVPGEMMNEDAI
jgi:flagellar biosynthetic protein FliO